MWSTVLLEGNRWTAALQRSAQLMWANWWTVLVVQVLIAAMMVVGHLIVGLLVGLDRKDLQRTLDVLTALAV